MTDEEKDRKAALAAIAFGAWAATSVLALALFVAWVVRFLATGHL